MRSRVRIAEQGAHCGARVRIAEQGAHCGARVRIAEQRCALRSKGAHCGAEVRIAEQGAHCGAGVRIARIMRFLIDEVTKIRYHYKSEWIYCVHTNYHFNPKSL